MKKVSLSVVMALFTTLLMTTTISAQDFSITLMSDDGSFESRVGVSLDPPSYPDGHGNSLYNIDEENSKSYVALDIDETKYAWITHPAPVNGQTRTTYGSIWSGLENIQQAINVEWQSWTGAYNWRLKIFSPSGTLLHDTSVPSEGDNSILRGELSLPILQTNDWKGGYPFQIEANPVLEPGSLLALGSGLVGLIGFGLRRRQ